MAYCPANQGSGETAMTDGSEAEIVAGRRTRFDVAEMGALAHLYRGEVYRSTIWRTRLDQTTNWAVVTTGLAMSLTFSGPWSSCSSSRAATATSTSGVPAAGSSRPTYTSRCCAAKA